MKRRTGVFCLVTGLVTALLIGHGPAWAQNGSGVPVAIVEALEGGSRFVPWDPTGAVPVQFNAGAVLTKVSPGSNTQSSHAFNVARRYFGDLSLTNGVTDIDSFRISGENDYLTSNYLRFGEATSPTIGATNARVFNHSWVGQDTDSAVNLELLLRQDWAVIATDATHVVGIADAATGAVNSLFSGGFNQISVGKRNGAHFAGTLAVGTDPFYVAGRVRPDVVLVDDVTSYTTARMSSRVVRLVEEAHENPSYSDGSFVKNGYTVYHGETPEVVKALFMTAATRGSNFGPLGTASWTASSANGLDVNYGAGSVDTASTLLILQAGEQGPDEGISQRGYDYHTISNGQTNIYGFQVGGANVTLDTTLAWHINVNNGLPFTTTLPYALYNLDLLLYDVTGAPSLVASSTGTIDSTENIFGLALLANRSYELRVLANNTGTFTWDYGLAWRFSGAVTPVPYVPPVAVPEPTTLGGLGGLGGMMWYLLGRGRKSQ